MGTQPNKAKIPGVLKDRVQWVVWRLVQRDGKNAKIPYNPRNPARNASSTDAKTWGTFEEAVQTYQDHGFAGIGFVFSKDDPFTGVDLDKGRNAETGELESWVQDIVEPLNSYSEVSPSGTGVHVLVQGTLPPGRRKKGQVEMYDQARFFCMTGDHLISTPTTIDSRQAELEGLHARVFGHSKMPVPASNGNHNPSPHPHKSVGDEEVIAKVQGTSKGEALWSGNFSQYSSQSEADMALCGQLARLTNGNAQQIDRLFRQSDLMRPKWDERHGADGHTYGAMTIAKAVEGVAHNDNTNPAGDPKGKRVPKIIAVLNRTHAVVMIGGQCRIFNEDLDPAWGWNTYSISTLQDFKNRYSNRRVGKNKRLGDVWLASPHRRQYEGIVFAPEKKTPGFYNLWRGFAVKPKPGDCSLFLRHIKWIIAKGDDTTFEYLVHWMASVVQFPERREGVSIVLRGKQGTGKGVMCTQFGKLFGSHFFHARTSKQLTGNFNAHLATSVLVFADEAFWAGDHAAEGALKALITEEQLPIEPKGKDIFYVRNHIHLLVASNHDWLVPAGLEERRFVILDVCEAQMQQTAYFKALTAQMDHGGREALLYHLLYEVDLAGVDLRDSPQTEALRENKFFSMPPPEKFYFEILSRGQLREDDSTWSSPVPRHILHEQYITFAKTIGQSRKSCETELGLTLKKLCPQKMDTDPMIGGKRVPMWNFPDVQTCRKDFDRITRSSHTWPE